MQQVKQEVTLISRKCRSVQPTYVEPMYDWESETLQKNCIALIKKLLQPSYTVLFAFLLLSVSKKS